MMMHTRSCYASLLLIAITLAGEHLAVAQSPVPTNTPSPKQPVSKPRIVATATASNDITFLTTNPPETVEIDELIAISGLVFEDSNRDGQHNAGEPLLKGVAISAEMPSTKSNQSAIATTDEHGAFHLYASRHALISVQVPDGFRSATPITRFASEQLQFGLQTDVMTVERVVQSPAVNVIAPPFQFTPEIMWAAWAFGLLFLAVAAIVVHRLSQQTQALREFVNTQTGNPIHDANWQTAVEQAIADSWGMSVQADSFLGLSGLPRAGMRFLMKDGRIFTFATTTSSLAGYRVCRPKRLKPAQRLASSIELRHVFEHFARTSNQPAMLPRGCDWFVCVDKTAHKPNIQIALPKSLRIEAAK